jgi:hypothetical protein
MTMRLSNKGQLGRLLELMTHNHMMMQVCRVGLTVLDQKLKKG